MIVVDASIVVEVLLRSDTGAALEERLFEGDDPLHAPHMLDIEVAHALRRCALHGDIDERHGRDSLGARGESPAAFEPRRILRFPAEFCCFTMHPACLRCSSVAYTQYAPSSRLVRRTPRRSRCHARFHHGLLGNLAAMSIERHGHQPLLERISRWNGSGNFVTT